MAVLQLPQHAWVPSPNYSSRCGVAVRLVVVHDCEGSYEGSISWFGQARSRVSAHVVLSDDGACATQVVAWANKAWHACRFNPSSEGIEAAGYAAKGLGAPEWRALAALVAWRLHANGIPCQRATVANGWTGWCQHVDLGFAGGDHFDVTSDHAVIEAVEAMIEEAYACEAPTSWGRLNAVRRAPAAPSGWKPSGTRRHDLLPGSLEWAQMEINALYPTAPPLTIDGLDGPATRAAVARFQSTHGLYVDGILGPRTIAALRQEAA